MKRVPHFDWLRDVHRIHCDQRVSSLVQIFASLQKRLIIEEGVFILPRFTRVLPSSMRSPVNSSDWRNWANPILERHRVPNLKYVPIQSNRIRIGKYILNPSDTKSKWPINSVYATSLPFIMSFPVTWLSIWIKPRKLRHKGGVSRQRNIPIKSKE